MDRSSQARDPFTVIPHGCETPIPPPSWYRYLSSSAPAHQKIAKPRHKSVIYRVHMHAERKYAKDQDHAAGRRPKDMAPEHVFCTQIGKDWREMSQEQQRPYQAAAAWEEKVYSSRWPAEREAQMRKRKPKREPAEVTEMKVRRAHLQAAQWKAEEARLNAEAGNAGGQSSLEPLPLVGVPPTSFGPEQGSSAYPTAEHAQWRWKKAQQKEDGHRVETAQPDNVAGQRLFQSAPLYQPQPVRAGYSHSRFLAAEVERHAGTASRRKDDGLRVESPWPGDAGSQKYPELFLPFQQPSSGFDYSR